MEIMPSDARAQPSSTLDCEVDAHDADLVTTTDDDFGFIVLRHVNDQRTSQYWVHCYDCIRR